MQENGQKNSSNLNRLGDFHVGSKLSCCVPFTISSEHKRVGVMLGMLDGGVAAVVPIDEQVSPPFTIVL